MLEKLTQLDPAWDGQRVNIVKIKPEYVSDAFDRFNANRFFGGGDKSAVSGQYTVDTDWKIVNANMEQSVPDTIEVPDDTYNYSMVTYRCLECGRNLAKILVKPFVVRTDDYSEEVTRVLTCKHCNIFNAPYRNQNFSVGQFYYSKTDKSKYDEISKLLDRQYR